LFEDLAQRRLAALRLASGDQVEIEGSATDLSVFGAIEATGEWEADVCSLLADIVVEDAVIIDIGANIGAHTLSFAKLAHRGHVIAFEADPKNFSLLSGNVERLQSPFASITTVQSALWSERTDLNFARIDQLAGCSFITPSTDITTIEAQIRNVVRNPAMADWRLDIHHSSIPAVALDDWVDEQNLRRLDLIKIDVEGSERFVLLGAQRTLRRFDPILITEYNPSCATTYQDEHPSAYFVLLKETFNSIKIIGASGALSQGLSCWDDLDRALDLGGGWVDLCCQSVRAAG
jgi:FkbM family methyltransferase